MKIRFFINPPLKAPRHGPQTWPWWRLVSFSFIRLYDVCKPSTGYRFWIYTRWRAFDFDLVFDRRPKF